MTDFYINPAISLFDNLKDTFETDVYLRGFLDQDKIHEFKLDAIDKHDCLFIIGEPGYGKTLLIKQLLELESEGKIAIRIDCRDFVDTKYHHDFEPFTHIYFDGLDEVPTMLFLESLNRIRSVESDYPGKKIFVACRTHYIQRFENQVKSFTKSKFLQLKPFEESHIRNYLNNFITDSDVIDAIVYNSTSRIGRQSVLRTPRYLAALVKSIQEEGIAPEVIKELSRTDIFERVIYCQLLTEVKRQTDILLSATADVPAGPGMEAVRIILGEIKKRDKAKLNANEVELTKRVLEKLAFIMEIYQRNRITKTELITFLDEAQSNISQIFLANSSIDRFIERTLKSVQDSQLVFEHTEFQEYLAAKELVRLSDSPQVLYDLVIEKEMNVIYSSWLDVLQFAIELDAEKVAGSLADFLKSNDDRQTDDRLIEILMGPGIDSANSATKGKLFAALYANYQKSGRYLFQKNDQLASLYVPDVNEELMLVDAIDEYNQDTIRQFINQTLLVRSLAESKLLSDHLRINWKARLLAALAIPELQSQYQVILWALELLDATTELQAMADEMKTKGDEQLSYYIQTMGRLNGDEMVDYFVALLGDRPELTGKDDFLLTLKTKEGLEKVFTELINNPPLIKSLFNSEYRYLTLHQLFDNIRKLNSRDLDVLVEKLFFVMVGDHERTYYSGRIKEYIDRAIEYLLKTSPDFLDRLFKHPSYGDILDISADSISNVMTLEQFDHIQAAVRDDNWQQRVIYKLVGHLKINGDLARQELLDALKEKFPEYFPTVAAAQSAEEQEERKRQKLSKELQQHLMPGEDYYSSELFRFYLNNEASLEGIIKPEEVEYIKAMLTNVIDKVQPEIYRVQLDRHGNGTTFNVNYEYWFKFGHFIDAAMRLGMIEVLQRNRIKLIKYLPLVNEYMINENDRLTNLQEFLGEITEAEAQELFEFCTNRNDDYIYSSAGTFSKIISNYHLDVFKPILKKMLESELTDYNEKKAAIVAFGQLTLDEEDKNYIRDIFNEYDRDDALKAMLAEQANEILIARFNDASAISWRFDQLESRQRKFPDRGSEGDPRPYTTFEQEMDRPSFASVFDELNEKVIKSRMESLLRTSLEIRKKDGFNRYSNYLQMIVYNYFNRHNDYDTLNRLRAILSEPTFKATASSFKTFMRNLEINLTDSVAKFQTISEPVKRYNEIKAKQYLKVRDVADLADLFEKGIEDLEDFVINKGYYSTIGHLSGTKLARTTKLYNEDILQKTLQITLENSLMKRGIRDTDIHREVELFDGKRLDLIVKYGFVGPIMAELKLLNNKEIQLPKERSDYKGKMKQYIAATKSEFAYYIIFKVENGAKHQTAYDSLVKEYSDLPNLKIRLIDCTV